MHCARFSDVDACDARLHEDQLIPAPTDCPSGLRDAAAPIVVGGRTIAYLLTSQMVGSEHDRDSALELLVQSGMDRESAEATLDQFPSVDPEVQAKAARVIANIATMIAGLANSYALNARLAIHDSLTGLFNRSYLWDLLTNRMQLPKNIAKPFSMVLFDLNGFKLINDIHGHRAGDHVLSAVAKVLAESTRPGDVPARYGGDEFVLILDDLGKSEAEHVAQRIADNVADLNIPIRKKMLHVTASFGIAEFPPNSRKTIEQLFTTADRNLYSAKFNLKQKAG